MIGKPKEAHLSIKSGDDEWYCNSYSPDLIAKHERSGPTVIYKAYRHWCERCHDDIPVDSRFDPDSFLSGREQGQLLQVETKRANPQNYLIVSRTVAAQTTVHCSLQNLLNPLHRRILQFDLLECKETRRPLYQGINQLLDGVEATYRRILLPVKDVDGKVTKVYSVYHLIESYDRIPLDLESI
jgi:hypothetical protein